LRYQVLQHTTNTGYEALCNLQVLRAFSLFAPSLDHRQTDRQIDTLAQREREITQTCTHTVSLIHIIYRRTKNTSCTPRANEKDTERRETHTTRERKA
jgi:hypothetical protein